LLEGSVTILLPKSKDILEKEVEENASFSEMISATSPINSKKLLQMPQDPFNLSTHLIINPQKSQCH